MTWWGPGLMLSGMHSRIVFLESRPGGILIDALTSHGQTLSMDAQVPVSIWGFAAALTLGQWAEQGSQVEVDLLDQRGVSRVRLSDRQHLVVLDLSRPAIVSRHPAGSPEEESGVLQAVLVEAEHLIGTPDNR